MKLRREILYLLLDVTMLRPIFSNFFLSPFTAFFILSNSILFLFSPITFHFTSIHPLLLFLFIPSSPISFQLFVSLRSQVAPYLYEDVLPCLQWLTKEEGVRVAVLTNGNANITSCSVLGEYITLSLG